MICPICEKRKAKRFCPAKTQTICSVCCGTEREVTIDCPSDCPHLVAARIPEYERREVDRSKLPFPDIKITAGFIAAHEDLLLSLSYAICLYGRDNPTLVDSDVVGAVQSLAETYRTLSSGIVYETPPEYRLQRELYQALKTELEGYKKEDKGDLVVAGAHHVRNEEIRDTLAFLTQLGAMRSNGRPKGRAYLDFLRTQFRPEEFSKPSSGLVVLP